MNAPLFIAAAVPGRTLWSVFTHLDSADWWTIAVACCCAVSCALPGCFLVLRRMSMMGDAISHSILPGLAVAFLVSSSRDPLVMLAGAAVAGLLTALLSWAINRWGNVPEDAALGVVFTSMFAVGVILIGRAARQIDLDPGCVLYGMLELTAIDTVRLGPGGIEVPRALVSLVPTLLLVAAGVVVFYKELKVASFDPLLAAAMGLRPGLLNSGLLAIVGITSVVSFEAVGSVLVVAMLVAPAATAHLLTDQLPRMLWLSCALAVSAAFVGYVLAVRFDTSAAGFMGAMGGAQFGLAAVFSPRHGAAAKAIHRLRLAARIAREDVLGLLYRDGERRGGAAGMPRSEAIAGLSNPLLARYALLSLRRTGLLETGSDLRLSAAGRDAARAIVRSHRLWESFLSREVGLPPDHVHAPSHRVEHFISPEMESGLRREIGATSDPHGREIPH